MDREKASSKLSVFRNLYGIIELRQYDRVDPIWAFAGYGQQFPDPPSTCLPAGVVSI